MPSSAVARRTNAAAAGLVLLAVLAACGGCARNEPRTTAGEKKIACAGGPVSDRRNGACQVVELYGVYGGPAGFPRETGLSVPAAGDRLSFVIIADDLASLAAFKELDSRCWQYRVCVKTFSSPSAKRAYLATRGRDKPRTAYDGLGLDRTAVLPENYT